jgi:hypothetical protein
MEPAPQSNATLRDVPAVFHVTLGMPTSAGSKVAKHTILNNLLGSAAAAAVHELTILRRVKGPCAA